MTTTDFIRAIAYGISESLPEYYTEIVIGSNIQSLGHIIVSKSARTRVIEHKCQYNLYILLQSENIEILSNDLRTAATLHYEDPNMIDQLRQTIARLSEKWQMTE